MTRALEMEEESFLNGGEAPRRGLTYRQIQQENGPSQSSTRPGNRLATVAITVGICLAVFYLTGFASQDPSPIIISGSRSAINLSFGQSDDRLEPSVPLTPPVASPPIDTPPVPSAVSTPLSAPVPESVPETPTSSEPVPPVASPVGEANSDSPPASPVRWVYSKMATIIPDLEHEAITADMKSQAQQQWGGRWKFYDGHEDERPADSDYCAQFLNRDIPNDRYPDGAWQMDSEYLNHFLDAASNYLDRIQDAIWTEYGFPREVGPDGQITTEALDRRLKAFRWEIIDLTQQVEDPPDKFSKSGSHGIGGWTTQRSHEGLVRRLLHAMNTNDVFTVVMAGHSAAAGHGNHFHQSYMMQFHRVMAPVFARLGVKLVTKNLAQGGLGTLQNSLASATLYGDEIDLLIWDAGMTEGQAEHIDMFYRQAILGGKKIPVIWGGDFHALRALHEYADVDVGYMGNGVDDIPFTEGVEQALTLPYAVRYMKCTNEAKDLCTREPRFCAHCWLNRSDLDPTVLFDQIDSTPHGQVRWHTGWRVHQLLGRIITLRVIKALKDAVDNWMDEILGGAPLDSAFWHMTDYYENIRSKVKKMDKDKVVCYKIAEGDNPLPARICDTPMTGRSLFTPRANPHSTSISAIVRPASNGYVPRNRLKVMYSGPDVHNECYDIPEGEVDILTVVSTRRSLLLQDEDFNHSEIEERAVSRNLDGAPAPGLGWEVVDEFPGDCDGEYRSICNRARNDGCPTLGHHDSRGQLVGNEHSGWIVMDLPDVKKGLIMIKLHTWLPETQNTITENWTAVNNERRYLRDTSHESDRQLKLEELPEEFVFEYTINGELYSMTRDEFKKAIRKVQRVVETIVLLDQEDFSGGPSVEVAFRFRNCRRVCTFGLTHVYWA